MVSFNKLTRTLAGIAAAALIVPLAACGGSGNGGTATAEGIPVCVQLVVAGLVTMIFRV